jgi:hypothetical protein
MQTRRTITKKPIELELGDVVDVHSVWARGCGFRYHVVVRLPVNRVYVRGQFCFGLQHYRPPPDCRCECCMDWTAVGHENYPIRVLRRRDP